MTTIQGFMMIDTHINNDVLMYIMSKKPDSVFKPWLKDRLKKQRVLNNVLAAKKLVKRYRDFKKGGQLLFTF